MKTKKGFSVLIILFAIALVAAIAGVVAVALYKAPETPKVTENTPAPTTTTTNSDQDIPPLYPKLDWGTTQKGNYLFTDKNDEILEREGFRIEAASSNDLTQFFFEYYKNKLSNEGWTETLSAGGPEGEMYSYQKSEKFINVGVDFNPDQSGPDRPIISYKYFIEYN